MLVMPDSVTHANADVALRMLLQSLKSVELSELVVDASALTAFDSSALAVLLQCRRAALQRQKTFAVRGLHPRLMTLAAVYGVAELLPAAAT